MQEYGNNAILTPALSSTASKQNTHDNENETHTHVWARTILELQTTHGDDDEKKGNSNFIPF